ncbi:hypothetical protein NJI34_00345 [Pseudomonas sp. S 311-6]|uniref:hypothetical protein n=1 Tax=Pseudomonas TaxID=286 RepID=UPI0020984D65|nr:MULTISPECIES: hypothetical protein [Pseudomonas]MCO7563576.1 hypothetical protein [Pseudomonas mosselii]MCO7616229.1 hypothetical protein [Pseudomonas guariconensis]MCO7635232.1 hypothetical protein [Pseudomonas sp. S 311-6]
MTVSTTDSVEEYVSGGPAFPIPYRFLQDSDIEAVLVHQDGTSETLVLGTQYTLTGAGSQNGGTLTSAYAAGVLATPGATLTISRIMTAVQPADLRNQGRYLAETHETVFDRLTMLIQQGFSWTRRALLRPIGKNYYDAEGRRIANVADPVEPQDAATRNWAQQYIADILATGQGPINNAANIVYIDANNSATTVQKAILKQFSSVSALRQKAGDRNKELAMLVSYYSGGNEAGGGPVRWDASSTDADNGYDTFSVTGVAVGRWKRVYDKMLDLYQFGGTYQGDCISAMDAALASPVEVIKVPDDVVLGYHLFDAPAKKIVIGGKNVSFSTFPCGLYPRNCKDIEIREFRELVLAMHPISGGSISTAQLFVALAPDAVIGDIRVARNSGSGGRLAISISFENGRSLTGMALVYENEFADQQGQAGGEGYGIHVSNENDTGDIFVMKNRVTRAGRHSFYFARNRGGGRMISWGNTAIDHRFNATTHDSEQRGAFQITRCKNVLSFGDMADGFYDGAMQISEENEAGGTLDAADITVRDMVIRKPYNTTPAMYVGYGVPLANGPITRSVLIDGLRFYCGGLITPVIQYTRGRNIKIRRTHAEYLNVPSGVIRPFVILGDTLVNSGNLSIKDTTIYCRGCSGATLQAFRLTGNSLTLSIPIDLDDLTMDSDTSSSQTFGPSATITQTAIRASGMALTGWNGATWPAARPDPSQVWNGQFITAGIATPVGNITPNFIGQDCYLQSNGTFWKAYGLTNASWKQTA